MKVLIEADIDCCMRCPFFCKGNCTILKDNVIENEDSNIDYEGLTGPEDMYIGCPLIYNKNSIIKIVK